MRLLIVLSVLALVAVQAGLFGGNGPRGTRQPGATRAPLTEEQKAKLEEKKKEAEKKFKEAEEKHKEKLAKLSPEAKALHAKIGELFKAAKDKRDAKKEIDALIAAAPESVQKEVKALFPNHHGGHHGGSKGGNGGFKGTGKPQGRNPRRTTVKA